MTFRRAFSTLHLKWLVLLGRKQLFLFAGIGLVLSGIATIFLIYQSVRDSDQSGVQLNVSPQQNNQFQLEEVHANPSLVIHTHAQIELIVDGQKAEVPAEIGIARELWHDHSLDEFSPSRALLAPLHTHDATGTLHIESVVQRDYTLGEFFSIWGIEQEKIVKVTAGSGSTIEDYWNHVITKNEKLVVELSG